MIYTLFKEEILRLFITVHPNHPHKIAVSHTQYYQMLINTGQITLKLQLTLDAFWNNLFTIYSFLFWKKYKELTRQCNEKKKM